MSKTNLGALIIAFGIFLASVTANATLIDFSGNFYGSGSITTDGSGNFTGTDIPVNFLLIVEAPSANGAYSVDAVLNFVFGPSVGNSIALFGTVPGLGLTTPGNLLTGSFTYLATMPGSPFSGVYGSGPDTKAADLLAMVGLPSSTPFEFFGFSVLLSDTGIPIYIDIANHTVGQVSPSAAVPEPSSLLLLGSGLAGLALWGEKRFRGIKA